MQNLKKSGLRSLTSYLWFTYYIHPSCSCVFFRSAAYILLLEGDRGQVFCSSPPGRVVCLLLCTGEFPIVQEQNVQARWERDG